ncbi:MAG: DUF1592 domain-containing protein, partial [Limisphaerales bacterium]
MKSLRTVVLSLTTIVIGAIGADFSALDREYNSQIRPLLDRYCTGCHDSETPQGELDLERFTTLAAVRKVPKIWQQVVYQIETGEMPPARKAQPTAAEKQRLLTWVQQYLRAEALANAGDPGPVILRRLSNAEYTYTIRDLTGVDSLDPLKEFPADSAAGEGFANAGAAMVMSPALLSKHLDAAKQVAKQAVLLPDGITWSRYTTERDWTDERLAAIRAFYRRFAADTPKRLIDRPGIKLNMVEGGAIPLERYLQAAIEVTEERTLATVAHKNDLSPKYLRKLWKALNDTTTSFLLDPIRQQWHSDEPDIEAIADQIRAWQGVLWRFASIGHIGKVNGPKSWQIPVLPLAESQNLTLALPESDEETITVHLVTGDAGDGSANDIAVWENARIEFANRSPIALAQIGATRKRIDDFMKRELPRTHEYLAAIARAYAEKVAPTNHVGTLDRRLFANWVKFTKLDRSPVAQPTGHFQGKLGEMSGYPDLKTWGSPRTPMLAVNQGNDPIRINTRTYPARGVTVHPSPTVEAVIFWRSPIQGRVNVSGLIKDADAGCGNGIEWRVEMFGRYGLRGIGAGKIDGGKREQFASTDSISVQPGDLLRVSVNPRDKNYTCDTTEIRLEIREDGGDRIWKLAPDIVDRIHDGNPLADSHGNEDTWHFCALPAGKNPASKLRAGSALAKWIDAVVSGAAPVVLQRLGRAVDPAKDPTLTDPHGALDWLGLALEQTEKIPPVPIKAKPGIGKFPLPAKLVAGGTFKVTARLHPEKGREGTVQMRVQLDEPATFKGAIAGNLQVNKGKRLWSDGVEPVSTDSVVITYQDSKAYQRLLGDIREHRALFPAALCYSKIVPVDEVVTLTLFHREDKWLRDLFLDEQQTAEIDRLWTELRFVSKDALKLVDVYEQLWQFATQDAKPTAFDPLRKPIMRRAELFRAQLHSSEPNRVDAVIAFASRAWRRGLNKSDANEIKSFYQQLKDQELNHADAIRLTLARVLIAPSFLYKSEQPGVRTMPVTGSELATRLSYFLWSSTPDAELLNVANRLTDGEALLAQTRRLLRSDKTERLALEFGAQWLGVRDFDQLDEKNERLYPEFKSLRQPMREEVVRFFADLFRNNRSVLSLLDADHTFANDRLAKFYGMRENETLTKSATSWVSINGIRQHDRGGILGMAATLARQSGASRTSPILRGNWIYETLLGQHLPNPPADVPQLPDALPKGLTERQLIERHSGDPACARCHERIDPYGFALESFDAIGRAREGADTSAKLPDGKTVNGLSGLRNYLLNDRRDEFVRQFCRKLLGFALGRSIQLSDEPLLEEMQKQLI